MRISTWYKKAHKLRVKVLKFLPSQTLWQKRKVLLNHPFPISIQSL